MSCECNTEEIFKPNSTITSVRSNMITNIQSIDNINNEINEINELYIVDHETKYIFFEIVKNV